MSANVKTWQPTRHQRLYRHSSGTYYVRLKRTWRSLKTDVLSMAIKKRDEEIALEAKREETAPEAPPPSLKTVGDAFNVRRRQIQNDVAKKASTKEFWEDIYKALPSPPGAALPSGGASLGRPRRGVRGKDEPLLQNKVYTPFF